MKDDLLYSNQYFTNQKEKDLICTIFRWSEGKFGNLSRS